MLLNIIAVIAAFGGAVSLISGAIAIYDFFKNRTIPPRIRNMLITSVVISTLFLTLLFTIPTLLSPSLPSKGNEVSTDTQLTTTSTSMSTPHPTPLPTPAPATPTPIPPPQCTSSLRFRYPQPQWLYIFASNFGEDECVIH